MWGEGMAGVCVPPVTQAGISVRVSKIWVLSLPCKLEKKQTKDRLEMYRFMYSEQSWRK